MDSALDKKILIKDQLVQHHIPDNDMLRERHRVERKKFANSQMNERHQENTDDSVVSFSGQFTHDMEGVLQSKGSDVVVRVPQGAVPEGKVYTIKAIIHTNLKDYNNLLQPNEYIAGPVPELVVEGYEAKFEKPVEVVIPHCIGVGKRRSVRVLQGNGQDFQRLPTRSFLFENNIVCILTDHFTKFIVTDHDEESTEVTDVLLTVAAKYYTADRKAYVNLRLMLHSHCATLNDFSAERRRFLVPGMEEIHRVKVQLPERTEPILFPEINMALKMESSNSKWTVVEDSATHTIDGIDVLKRATNGVKHRSEQLCDFLLEKLIRSPQRLNCFIHCTFKYDNMTNKLHRLHVVYPQTSSGSGTQVENNVSTIKNVIDNNGPGLLGNLRVTDMFKRYLVSEKALDDSTLKECQSDDDILKAIRAGSTSQYHGFRRAVQKTNQQRVLELLPEDVTENDIGEPRPQPKSKAKPHAKAKRKERGVQSDPMQNRVRPISDEADSSDNIEEKEEERPKPKLKRERAKAVVGPSERAGEHRWEKDHLSKKAKKTMQNKGEAQPQQKSKAEPRAKAKQRGVQLQNRVHPISDVEADSSDNGEEKEEERPKPKVMAKGAARKGAPPHAAATASVLTEHRYNEDKIPDQPPTKRSLRLAVVKAARAGQGR